jgi:DNA gyrase subunit B
LIVTFYPDDKIFETVEFDKAIIRTRLREQAFLNAGVCLTNSDKRETESEEAGEEVFCYEGGIKSFVEYINSKKAAELLHEDVILFPAQRVRLSPKSLCSIRHL